MQVAGWIVGAGFGEELVLVVLVGAGFVEELLEVVVVGAGF